MVQSRSPRCVAPGHSRTEATFSSLAFEEAHRAAQSRSRPECPSRPPKKKPQRRCPAEVRAMASSKVARIQAAIANLAVDDIEEKASLEAALVRAQRQASVPPVDKRIADSMAFIERAKKRVAAESAKILEAEKMRRIYQDELEHAEKELQEVREEAERQKVGVVEVNPVAELEAELSRVRAQLVQLQSSRPDPEVPCGPNVKRPCLSGQGRVGIPPMPTLVPAELSAWLSERHSDLHDALINGDPSCVLELTTMLSDGAERLVAMTGRMLP